MKYNVSKLVVDMPTGIYNKTLRSEVNAVS